MGRAATFSLVSLVIGTGAPDALAENNAAVVRAEELFNQALADFDAGRIPEACRKFRESMDIDPANGTLLNLARCHEREGKLSAAWAAYRDAAVLSRHAGQQERAAVAEASAARLAAQLPRLRVLVADAPPGTAIAANGMPFLGSATGEPVVVDPGVHHISVSAPGRAPYETTVTVPSSSQVSELVVPPLQPAGWTAQTPLFWGGFTIGALGLSSLIAGAAVGGTLLAEPSVPDADERERAAIALLSIGAALGASGVVMIVIDQSETRSGTAGAAGLPAVRLVGSAEPGGGRATIAFDW